MNAPESSSPFKFRQVLLLTGLGCLSLYFIAKVWNDPHMNHSSTENKANSEDVHKKIKELEAEVARLETDNSALEEKLAKARDALSRKVSVIDSVTAILSQDSPAFEGADPK